HALRISTGAAAAAVLAFGAATLVEYVSGADLGIDRLLFRWGSGPHPGRPSPPSSFALTALGAALLLFDVRPRARLRPSEWMILTAVLVGFTVIVGFACGTGFFYRTRSAPIMGVSVPTALSL